eukprot:jgi/Tetstr1/437656/TSEL_026323.t1
MAPVLRPGSMSSRHSLQAAPLRQQRIAAVRPVQRPQIRAESGSNLDLIPSPSFRRVEQWAEDNRRGITATINGTVVAMVVLGASYKFFEVDLEISRGWTWLEFIINTFQDDFLSYEKAIAAHPVFTKACTSGVAYTLGDFAAQTFQGRNILNIDLSRTLRSGVAGFCIHGPFCHLWIQWMEANLGFGGAWWNIFPKVVADQTVWSIFLNTMYTSTILALNLKSPSFIAAEVKTTAWPALSSGWRFWPFVHCISFSPLIPEDLKLLFIDTMEIIWVTILATVVNRPTEGEPVLVCSIEPGIEASKPGINVELQAEAQAALPQVEDEDGQLRDLVLSTMDMRELVEMAQNAGTLDPNLSEEDLTKLTLAAERLRFDVSEELDAMELEEVAKMLGITITEDLLPDGLDAVEDEDRTPDEALIEFDRVSLEEKHQH